MTTLQSLADSRFAIFAGWTLLVILWETTAVGVVLAAWRGWHVQGPARMQHSAAVLALTAAIVMAAATPVALLSMPARPPMSSVAAPVLRAPASVGEPERPAEIAAPADRRPGWTLPADSIAAAAFMLWAAGVSLLSMRLAGGWLLASRIRRRATPIADVAVHRTAGGLIQDLRLTLPVTLVQSRDVEAPVVIGWRRPALVLPADVGERLSPDMLAAVMAHEFAHIERRDYLANLLQSVVELVLFFSPAIQWMSRCIREAREYCCDDVAVERCGDPRHYVQALTTLASLGAINTAGPVMGAAGPRLITRVRRLLHAEARPRWTSTRLVALAGCLAVLMVTGFRVVAIAAAYGAEATRRTAAGKQTPRSDADRLPIGFATEQEGSGVDFHVLAWTRDEPLQRVSIRNLTNVPVSGVRIVAAVERLGSRLAPFRLPVRLFISGPVPVSVAPGQTVELSPDVLSAEQVEQVQAETPDTRLQLFFGLSEVQFANGSVWSISPNPAALNGSDALGTPRPLLSRSSLDRNAVKPEISRGMLDRDARKLEAHGPCFDERERAYSHGAVVPLRNEPGRGARCDGGRWLETALR